MFEVRPFKSIGGGGIYHVPNHRTPPFVKVLGFTGMYPLVGINTETKVAIVRIVPQIENIPLDHISFIDSEEK